MPSAELSRRLDDLKDQLVEQGERVQRLVELALACALDRSSEVQEVQRLEDEVDRVDVLIERRAVALLCDATREGSTLEHDEVRLLLTVVKVNNELERIADLGATVVDRLGQLGADSLALPTTALEVIINSVVGILRDTTAAIDRMDADLARVVLRSEDVMEAFRAQVLRDSAERIAAGSLNVDVAQFFQAVAGRCVSMADHCTNIAQQIIYARTARIVRHTEAGWVDVTQEPAGN